MFKRKKEIQFSGREHSRRGILAFVISLIIVIGFITISIISSTTHGNGGIVLGYIGLSLFALSIFGFYHSYKACKEKDIYYRFPVLGLLLNGVMAIVLLTLYILGI